MAAMITPANAKEIGEIFREAAASGTKLQLRGGGSKDGTGAPCGGAAVIDMTAISGVVDYDPAELVLTVRAGTPTVEVDVLLRTNGQMLAFEPWDAGPLFGMQPGRSTIGGVIASGQSGSQRLTLGGVRDHLLGFSAVSGRGEMFVAGAKVVKNVTGYDVPKLMAGSWGRLAALAEVTLKVLPRPAARLTAVALGLDARQAWRAMAHHLGSGSEVAAAAHLPAGMLGSASVTALRVQGFAPSVEARCQMIEAVRRDDGRFCRVDESEAAAIWSCVRTLDRLPPYNPLWRVSLPARAAADFLAVIEARASEWLMDWAGGLVWYAGEADPSRLRAAAASLGGHAMLLRGDEGLRARVAAHHPPEPVVAALEERMRRAFDPAGIFETGRF